MAILPLGIARVSNLLQTNTVTQTIDSTQQQLLDVENQLSTGKRINQPSDDPGSAAVIQQLQKTLEVRQGYSTNLNAANSQLSEVDSTLGSLTDLLQQAQNIASQNVGTDVTAAERASAASVVQSLANQAFSIGNTEFNGSYLFGGDKSNTAPFVDANGGVMFVGSSTILQNTVAQNAASPLMVNGAGVFGALSTRVQGATDLAPSLTTTTRIGDLGGTANTGVHLGSIQIGNGTVSKNIDLSKADGVQDVINQINAAAVGNITASLNSAGTGLQLTTTSSTDNISVTDIGGGSTAADLGILQTTAAGVGNPVVGQDVNTKVTDLTKLADLRGGAGIDLASGITITNGATTKTITFTGDTTVEDLLNSINGAGVNVQAQINANGTGIDIINPTQGTDMTIAENGGTTGADLGVLSFTAATPLSELNEGKGVGTVTGNDFQITRRDGTVINVDLNGPTTVQDVINQINVSDPSGGVVASLATTGNGIILTDTTGATTSPLSVTALNSSTALQDLGLARPTASPSGNALTGTDVNPVSVNGIFGNLQALISALQSSNQSDITQAAEGLQNDYSRVVQIRGQNGASLQEVQSRQSQLQDENTSTQSLLSQIQDTDFTTAITQFQTLQTSLQAAYTTASKTMNLSLMDFLS